jgi:hypothetical protein
MKRKRIKKYNNGGFSGLVQGAAQGAPLGLPGMIIGGGLGYLQGSAAGNAQEESLRMDAEARKLKEEQRAIEERNAAVAQNKAILDAFPVQGTTTPRFAAGGDTSGDPLKAKGTNKQGKKYNINDLPIAAKRMAFSSADIMDGLGNLSEDELTALIGEAVRTEQTFKGLDSNWDKIKAFKDMDLSWVKPIRKKTGLSKGEIIDAAAKAGVLKQSFVGPVKAAASFMNFENGGGTVTPAKALSYQQPQLKQYEPSKLDLLREAFYNHNMQDDSTFENAMEIIDPTGISSYDDVMRAEAAARARNGQYTADEALDFAGAMPIFGKLKAGINLGKGTMAGLKHGFKMSGEIALEGAKRGSNVLNVVDGVEDETGFLNNFAMGGSTLGPQYEVEGGEMMQTGGETPQTYGQGNMSQVSSNEFEVKGPKHSNGGVKASDNNGARVYSDKLRVDPSLMSKLMKL